MAITIGIFIILLFYHYYLYLLYRNGIFCGIAENGNFHKFIEELTNCYFNTTVSGNSTHYLTNVTFHGKTVARNMILRILNIPGSTQRKVPSPKNTDFSNHTEPFAVFDNVIWTIVASTPNGLFTFTEADSNPIPWQLG